MNRLGARLMCVVWPAFLAACGIELLVFALVDPHDLHWAGESLAASRQGVYTLAFFAFWGVGIGACALTAMLARPAEPMRARDAQ